MEEMHFTTPFFLMEGRNQRLQRRACGVNVVAIQCVSYPFDLVAKLDGASTPPHDTSAIRSFAATASSAQTDGHNLRSDRVSNANVRVLMDDSA